MQQPIMFGQDSLCCKSASSNLQHQLPCDALLQWRARGYELMAVRFDVQVFQELPMEFAAEVNQLMSLKLEGSVG